MEKKTLILLLFFICVALQGQTEYGILVETELYPFAEWNGSHGGSHSISVGNNTITKRSNVENDFVTEYDFFYVTNPIPTKITWSSRTVGNINETDCEREGETEYIPKKFDRVAFTGCNANSLIMGIYLPQQISNSCKEDIITFNRGWNWKYSYDGISWNDFPSQYQAKRSISFKVKDLVGYKEQSKVYFKTGYNSNFTDFVVYDIFQCPPNLEGLPTVVKPFCYDANNGKVTFTFDRDLILDERFLLNLTQIVNGNNLPPIMKNVSMADFPNRQITFTNLTSGTYFLRYQTFQNNGLTPTSDNTSAPFSINQPSPLRFTITPVNPSCNGGNGEILINASDGTPPYYYSINNGTKTQFANGSKTIPVPNGVYSIKITDENNCIEK